MCAVMGVSFSSFLPSRRRPVPPSKMRIALPARTSTQLVLPPIWTVAGPGVGMLPRTPQKVICIVVYCSSASGGAAASERTSGPRRKVCLVLVRAYPRKDDARRTLAPRALVVLGCRVSTDGEGRLVGALRRRVEAAASAYAHLGDTVGVGVASGGRRWSGDVEADAMARELVHLGVPERVI